MQTLGLCTAITGHDETLLTGFLSGTEPLYAEMGLNVVGPITPPTTPQTTDTTGDVVVRYAIGAHTSLLSTAGGAAVTCDMQRQAATFLGSNRTTVTISGTCP